MSARSPRDPPSDRRERSPRPIPDFAGNEPVDDGRLRSSRGAAGGARNEIVGRDGPGYAIARTATRQNGALTRKQLVKAGLDDSGVDRRARNGLLHRIHRGVYVLGHEAFAQYACESAALLAAGERAVVSHATAASLWGFAPPTAPDADIHITTIGAKVRSRPGLIAHRSNTLEARDIRRLHDLPVTAPARTLFDLAATGYRDLDRAFGDAHAQRLVNAREIEQLLERVGPRAGSRALRSLLSDNASGFTRSKAEHILRSLLRSANLPLPRFNARVAGYEVDAFWPEHGLVVEVDGYAYHGHRAQFERDRRKDLALTAAGYRVIRVSWRQLTQEPFALIAVISPALSDSRKPG
jgi:very-short-patch-repair endonuclease